MPTPRTRRPRALVLKVELEREGATGRWIADVLNIKVETAKVRVFRARQKIREILQPYLDDMKN